VALDGDKGLGVADGFVVSFLGPLVALLLLDEAPYFIALHVPYPHVHHQPAQELLAALPGQNQ